MATYIKTLKEDNGDITYPQTKAGAVLLDNGSDLETELSQYVTAENIASTSALTPPVQTNMIADGAVTTAKITDGAVTSDKIDWGTFIKTGTVQVEYQASNTAGGFAAVTFDTPFKNTPVVFAQDLLSNGSVSSVTVSLVTTTGFRVLARTSNPSSSGTATVNWLAFSQQG